MSQHYDLAIIGGGCAGLSLARDLIKRSADQTSLPRTVIIEPRTGYANDRTWCFWSQNIGSERALVKRQWRQWSFSSQGQQHLHEPGEGWSYHCIPAVNFYQHALNLIGPNDRVELRKGDQVKTIEPLDGSFRLQTLNGDIIADKVIDTRPPTTDDHARSTLLQAFIGVEIRSEQALVKSDQVGLMEDMASDEFGFKFNYILPMSSNHILIESTRFCRDRAAIRQLDADLEQALKRYSRGADYQIVRREQGVIPMGLEPAADTLPPNWIRAGSGGGAIRAATGYAFRRIQNWSRQCADQLLEQDRIIAQPAEPALLGLMDQVFLRVIRHHPELAPDFFMALAEKVEPAALVRFLTDQPRLKDMLAVVLALPAWPFIKQLNPARLRNPKLPADHVHRG